MKSNGISVDFFIPSEWGDIKDYKDRFAYKKSNSIIVKPKRSSGSKGVSINESIRYIKSLPLDYVVFGSSKLSNIEKNKNQFRDRHAKRVISS